MGNRYFRRLPSLRSNLPVSPRLKSARIDRRAPMTLSDLIEKGRFAAERGRALAELVPYGFVALVSCFAIASVFWRSGQTKVQGFHIREETFDLFREEYKVPLLPPDVAAYMSTTAEHVFPVLLVVG